MNQLAQAYFAACLLELVTLFQQTVGVLKLLRQDRTHWFLLLSMSSAKVWGLGIFCDTSPVFMCGTCFVVLRNSAAEIFSVHMTLHAFLRYHLRESRAVSCSFNTSCLNSTKFIKAVAAQGQAVRLTCAVCIAIQFSLLSRCLSFADLALLVEPA